MKKRIWAGISMVLLLLAGIISLIIFTKKAKQETDRQKKLSEKHFALFQLMNKWVEVKQKGKKISDYFKERNYNVIAIYGMNFVGERLLEELQDSGITVKYGIDQNADNIYADIKIVKFEDEFEKVDVIVVTAITCFEEIEDKLVHKINCPIISLDDILYEI